MVCLSMRSALASAFNISLRPTTKTPSLTPSTAYNAITRSTRHQRQPQHPSTAHFSTSAPRPKKGERVQIDKRITLIRYHLHHPTTLTPRPLRFSRNRSLRHWTIHRAWTLYRANLKKARELELERQYNAMAAANEELRMGAGDGGRLFRKAMMKVGTWSIPERGGGVPIEYARAQVEWIGSGSVPGGRGRVWDSEWRRAG